VFPTLPSYTVASEKKNSAKFALTEICHSAYRLPRPWGYTHIALRDEEGEIHMARRRTLYLPLMIAAAVAVACLVALSAVSEKAEAAFPGKNGRIAYACWNRGKDFEIYTINPNGSGKTQLTHNNTDDIDPAYSPDGKKIVYAGEDGPKGDLKIYTINASGGISSKSPTTMRTLTGTLGVVVRSGSFP
jgi:WD40-like Beta Propeller Repeat